MTVTSFQLPASSRPFGLAVLFVTASCVGGSRSPTVSTPIPALPSGAYVLNISIGGGGGQFTTCVSSGALDIGGLATNVELQHTGNTVTIQPDDSTATFRMDLQMFGATLSGTASGQFLSAGRVVTVAGQNESAAAAVGTASGSGAAGNLTGNVGANSVTGTVGAGGIVSTVGLACNGGNWSVAPR